MRLIACLIFIAMCLPGIVHAETIFTKARATVETGAQAGGVIGVEGPTHSTFRGVSEIGVMFDRVREGLPPKTTYGVVLYGAIGNEDFRIALKPKLRYRFRPKWSTDITAGYIFASLESGPYVSQTGIAGGATLNYSNWLSFKADVNVVKVEDRPRFEEGKEVGVIKGGHEISVYGGVSLRNHAGWMATVIGTSVFLAFVVIVMAEGGGS